MGGTGSGCHVSSDGLGICDIELSGSTSSGLGSYFVN